MIGFIDTETGGFSIEKNGVCEIAIIATTSALNVVDVFHILIQPYTRPCGTELVSYKDDAMAINGLTVEKLQSEGIPVEEAMNQLVAFCHKHGIDFFIGHNLEAFDLKRIDYLLKRFAPGQKINVNGVKCTMKMAKEKHPNLSSYKQEDLLRHFGIAQPATHTALGDATGCIDLFKKLACWKEPV